MKERFLLKNWLPLLVLLVFAVPSILFLFPMRVLPEDAPPEAFSARRALKHLPTVAGQPHPEGSPAQAAVRDYLISTLTALGVETATQNVYGAENVVASLPGTGSGSAVLFLAHYDSSRGSPGAGDNGSGVAVLLELARALSSGPTLMNGVILLFDDGEELPDAFTGSKAFVREHPLMESVRVAVSIDTATAGHVSVCETGEGNGWLVRMLSAVYTNGAWTSFSGGGGYDSKPFRDAGVMTLALEDNYPFREKHTPLDTPDVVKAGSLQQMGDTALALARKLGAVDLSQTRAEERTFFPIPFIALAHYPVSWTVPLFILACAGLFLLLILSFRGKTLTAGGFFIALGGVLVACGISAALIALLKPLLPGIFGWETSLWPDWPEVIPPNAWIAFAAFALLVVGISTLSYRLCRKRCTPVEFSIAALLPIYLFAGGFSFLMPRMAYPFLWTALIGSLTWMVYALIHQKKAVSPGLFALLTALPPLTLLLPLVPGIVMADGLKSLEILGAVFALILSLALPALDGLLIRGGKGSA